MENKVKTAIYIEDGTIQLVITPESEFEKNAMASFSGEIEADLFSGSFYDCRGGWVRQSHYVSNDMFTPHMNDSKDKSLIIRTKPKEGL